MIASRYDYVTIPNYEISANHEENDLRLYKIFSGAIVTVYTVGRLIICLLAAISIPYGLGNNGRSEAAAIGFTVNDVLWMIGAVSTVSVSLYAFSLLSGVMETIRSEISDI
jgi:hypothetical protein